METKSPGFEARVLRVLIASPSDVSTERALIPDIINDWNAINAVHSKFILMPIKWETHSAPMLGSRPQAVINQQLVQDCDLLVGVFWTRIGTDTGVAVSGTAEEIEQFVKMGKPVMLYFSKSQVGPDEINLEQLQSLRDFRDKVRTEGLTESYNGVEDFRQKFSRQLGIVIEKMLVSSVEVTDDISSLPTQPKTATNLLEPVENFDTAKEVLTSEKADEFLIKAINNVAGEDGWAGIAAVGTYLKTFTPIDYRNFGHQKLKAFIKSRELFEIKEEKKSPQAKNIDSAFIRIKEI